ncbi:4Fe-4S dicluster domain-containing protein [Neobacillus sp. LXY-4]|uniref:4Fe-4S dicluster domain-containing protein n=1 Tax=Neobacillus sp. LXY-4 TaxID=3379826 RepID=UPI003EE199D1
MPEKLTRRDYLTLNWESTVGFLSNFLVPQMEVERTFIRPPGSSEELQFLTSCSRCGDCKKACPEQCIQLFSMSNGVKIAGTPYLDLTETACTFCKKCIEVCPTGALNERDERLNRSIGSATINRQFCLAYHDVMCDYCVRSCPVEGAIRLREGKPEIQFDLCTGCGICRQHCLSENKAISIIPQSNGMK